MPNTLIPSFHLNNISYHIITKYSSYSGLQMSPGVVCRVITEVSHENIVGDVSHAHIPMSTKPLPCTLDMHCICLLPQQGTVFCQCVSTGAFLPVPSIHLIVTVFLLPVAVKREVMPKETSEVKVLDKKRCVCFGTFLVFSSSSAWGTS